MAAAIKKVLIKKVDATERAKDIGNIMKSYDEDIPEHEEIVHISDVFNSGFVKKYVYNGTKKTWEFNKRMTQADADAEVEQQIVDESDDNDDVVEEKPKKQAKKPEAKTKSPPKVKEPAAENAASTGRFTKAMAKEIFDKATELKLLVKDANALTLVEDILGIAAGSPSSKKPVATKKQAQGEKTKSEYHQFLSDELVKMQGDKTIPGNQRMAIALQRWRDKKQSA